MTGDSTIADFDDGRIGLGAGVRSADGTICLSCFRLMRTPSVQAIVSGSGALHCPLKSVAASVSGGKTHVPIALIAADVPWADSTNVIVLPYPCCGRWSSRGVSDPQNRQPKPLPPSPPPMGPSAQALLRFFWQRRQTWWFGSS